MNSRKTIDFYLKGVKENTLIEVFEVYKSFEEDMTEYAFYKSLERLCKENSLKRLAKGIYYKPKQTKFGIIPIGEQDIISHYTEHQQGLVVGYKLFNKKGITTQVGKQTEVLSNHISGQKKTVQNVLIKGIACTLNEERINAIETLEILQNYSKVEDLNKKALIHYMESFSSLYSDDATIYVLNHIKYKKSTIAFLEAFLNHLKVENTLGQFLSSMSLYKYPPMKELYETA